MICGLGHIIPPLPCGVVISSIWRPMPRGCSLDAGQPSGISSRWSSKIEYVCMVAKQSKLRHAIHEVVRHVQATDELSKPFDSYLYS